MADISHASSKALTDADPSPHMAGWEIYLKKELESELRPELSGDRYELLVLGIIRDLLRLENSKLDSSAADRAAQKIRDCYHDADLDEDGDWYFRRDDDHGASDVTQTVCGYVWEMALQFPETDVRQTTLVNPLVALKRGSSEEFDPEVGLMSDYTTCHAH